MLVESVRPRAPVECNLRSLALGIVPAAGVRVVRGYEGVPSTATSEHRSFLRSKPGWADPPCGYVLFMFLARNGNGSG